MHDAVIWHRGFDNLIWCVQYIQNQIQKTNRHLQPYQRKLHLQIVDACVPEHFQNGTDLLVTNNWILPGQIDPARYEQFASSFYGMYAGKVQPGPTKIIKKFNCFIKRMDPIRQSWFYQLIRRDILAQGLVSFLMDTSRHVLQKQCAATDTAQEVFQQQFEQWLKIFDAEHQIAKSIVPYRNFDVDLSTAIMQTQFSIVLETYFDRNSIITVSEKIFRCLKLPRPWILFSAKGAVAYLRNLGFDTLDDVVDHDCYDGLDAAVQRQSKLLDLAEELIRLKFSNVMITRCQQAADHNNRLLEDWWSTWHDDVDSTVERARIKVMAL